MIAVMFSFTAMAQLTYGPKLGLNLANVSGDDVEDSKMLIGFNAGLMLNYGITDMFSAQAEVLYDVKGAKFEGVNEDGEEEDMPFTLSYISIPLLAKATFGASDTKFYGEVGPTIGLLMGVKMDGESEAKVMTGIDPVTFQPIYEDVKYKDYYKGTDIGIAIGAGTVLPAGGMKLLLGARYNMGLGTIAEEPEGGGDAGDIKNGVISINAGLLFGGK